jgi:hypothetical protein
MRKRRGLLHIGEMFIGVLVYADGITLLSPSSRGCVRCWPFANNMQRNVILCLTVIDRNVQFCHLQGKKFTIYFESYLDSRT